MTTKFILVGGYPHKAPDEGKSFCEELVAGFSEPVKLLDCLFARPRENWDKAFDQDKEFFARHLPGKQIDLQRADPDSFVEQVRWADAVYIRGGDTEVLIDRLNQCGNWQNELMGKTLAGSSAGADAIAKYYYGLDTLQLKSGLGLVPVKVIVHWMSGYNAPNIKWEKAYEELKTYKEDLPVVKLKEGEFVVFV